jgi:hypothetical protein
MRRLLVSVLPLVAAAIFLVPHTASAQVGSIAGVVKDASGAVLPGVTVEVASPALIEKVRSTTTDDNGRYQIPALSVGSYSVTMTLAGFSTFKRQNVIVTSDFTATVNAEMSVGGLTDTVNVTAEPPIVNTTTASVQQVLQGAEIADLPTQRDIPSLLNLVPGFQSSALRGACDGGVGVFCNPTVPLFNSHTSASDTDGQNQGRIMVDGMSINMGRSGVGINENVGQANGIVLNTAAAQEVSFTLSGSLGESETGGAAINIVPRTGGNRFSGGYALTYANTSLFDRNTGTRLTWSPATGNTPPARNAFVYDYDMTGTFGGPVKKDRMWFYLQARKQERQQWPGGDPGYLNKNAGLFGANYEPLRDCSSVPRDCKDGQLTYTNQYQNASARLTIQASPKNKVNIYWDEQDSCTNPCYGMISNINSPESYFTLQSRPNRLMQVSWTNPLTNRLLFDAGLSAVITHQDQTRSREFTNPRNIPRICETGTTVGLDDVSSRVNNTAIPFLGGAGACGVFSTFGSGSVNDSAPSSNPFLNTPNQLLRDKTFRSRASASYITGTHNVKVGWDGAYFGERTRNEANDLRLNYHYATPVTTGTWNATTRTVTPLLPGQPGFPGHGCLGADPVTSPYACGNMSLYYPTEPNNTFLRPAPVGVDVNSGEAELDERVWFGALYAQDQWTYNRFTINGALRYDHARSRYGATCIGPDVWVPTQWCSEAQDGVSYNDITPRWGVAWDVFGTGKTSIKWNMGKYLQAAGFGGNYTGFNDARRATNQLTRGWNDLNGNRIFECDMSNPAAYYTNAANPAAGDFCGSIPASTFASFGQPPNSSALANATAPCGFTAPHATQGQVDYCNAADQNLMDGWGKRRNEWQFGLGIQHEVLPRMSVEVTYNRRKYGNLTDTDTVNVGCDYFQTATNASTLPASTCTSAWQNYSDPTGLRDFYTFQAPPDPRLPDGGNYVIQGLNNQSVPSLPVGSGGVVLLREQLDYTWAGIDTNVVMRARGNLRLSGGTSTGRSKRDTCDTNIDSPNVKGRVGNELGGGCINNEPYLTNVRGNVTYTIPWIDVLASGVFQYRPGVTRSANMTVNTADVVWSTPLRSGTPFFTGIANGTSTTTQINLLDNNDLYGEGMRLFDLTFRKNVRFAGKRLSLGLDVYNVFNSDAALGYQNTYTAFKQADGSWGPDNPATPQVEVNDWGRITSITNPRFARFSMTFDF